MQDPDGYRAIALVSTEADGYDRVMCRPFGSSGFASLSGAVTSESRQMRLTRVRCLVQAQLKLLPRYSSSRSPGCISDLKLPW